jgi:hypothetical protein
MEGNSHACCHDPFVETLARVGRSDYNGVANLTVELNRRQAPRLTKRPMKIDDYRQAESRESGGRSLSFALELPRLSFVFLVSFVVEVRVGFSARDPYWTGASA